MWDDFKIGKGKHGNTAVTVQCLSKKNLYISENSASYWIIYTVCGERVLGGIVMKDTQLGKTLTSIKNMELGDDFKSTKALQLLLPRLFQSLTDTKLVKLVNTIVAAAVQQGKRIKTAEIKAVLEL